MTQNELIGTVPETAAEALASWRLMRERLHDEFEQAKSAERRVALLALHQSIMNLAEQAVAANDLEKFREIRGHSYSLLIVKECLVGDQVCTKIADAVTRREVAAGRMTPNHDLRKMEAMMTFASQVLQSRMLIKNHEPPAPGLMGRALNWLLN